MQGFIRTVFHVKQNPIYLIRLKNLKGVAALYLFAPAARAL